MTYFKKLTFVINLMIIVVLSSCGREGDGNHGNGIAIEFEGLSYEYELPYRQIIEPQRDRQRVWNKTIVSELKSVSEDLFTPIRIALADSSVYILDPADGYVKAFSKYSEDLRKIGPGKGRGPGEVSYPFEFAVDKSGNIFITDIERRALIVWDRYGNPVLDYTFQHTLPAGLAPLNDDRVIVMVSGSNFTLNNEYEFFHSYDIKKNETVLFSKFLTDVAHLPEMLALDRAFVGNIVFDDDRLIYAPRHLNHIIYFSLNGEVDLVRQTIDDIAYPKIVQARVSSYSAVSTTSLSSDSETVNLDIFLIDESLVIWSQPGMLQYGQHVFDFYSRKSGDYQFSIKIPEIGRVVALAMNEHFIAAINSDNSVSLWEYYFAE